MENRSCEQSMYRIFQLHISYWKILLFITRLHFQVLDCPRACLITFDAEIPDSVNVEGSSILLLHHRSSQVLLGPVMCKTLSNMNPTLLAFLGLTPKQVIHRTKETIYIYFNISLSIFKKHHFDICNVLSFRGVLNLKS